MAKRSGRRVALHQFKGDALGTLEQPQLSVDVVHLVAEHRDAVGCQVRGGRLDVGDAEGEVVEAPPPQVRRVRVGIAAGVGSNASSWISKRGVTPSRTRVMCSPSCSACPCTWPERRHRSSRLLLPEAKQREERDRRIGIRHRDRDVIRIEQHLIPLRCVRVRRAATKLSITFFSPAFSKATVSLLPSTAVTAP